MAFSYILIDTTLIGYPENKPWIKKRRKPSWISAIYERDAIRVSPILIDVERAWHCGRIDAVMALINTELPQLGISFIETALPLIELQIHLRRFIFVLTEDGAELTLRFADGAVLSALSTYLTNEQWAALVGPLESWKMHGRDGKLKSLPILRADLTSRVPLSLSEAQISSLRDSSGADQLLANLRKMRPGCETEYSTAQAHHYAEQIRQMWLSAGREEDTDFLLFARDVFQTEGRLLRHPGLRQVLEEADPEIRGKDLRRLTSLQFSGNRQ